MIPAGKRNTKLTFQKSYYTRALDGEETEAWSTLFSPWGSVETVNGRELFKAQRINPETTAVFTIPFVRGITHDMRIMFNNRYFNIIGINDVDNQHRDMIISAKEVI